jgi:uncharacterized protein (TIGR02996 family)
VNADAEQDALLAAIFAAPADDTPRLVYADWLEEHGEPEYAEFIRLQIACARQPNPVPRRPFERREREVWKKLKRKWRDLLAPPTLVTKEQFRRGFVSGSAEGTCPIPADRFLERSADLWPRLPLRDVELTPANGSVTFPAALLDCAHLRRLTRLKICSRWDRCIDEKFAVRLFSCDPFDRLRDLSAERVPLSRPVIDALRAVPYLPRLRYFVVRYMSTKYGPRNRGLLQYPRGDAPPEPDSAHERLAEELSSVEPDLVVVPPGETDCEKIADHTRWRGPAAP